MADEPAPSQAHAEPRSLPGPDSAAPTVRIILGLALVALVGGALWYWQATNGIETTDDAYTDGRAVMLAPHVTGYVIGLDAADNHFVHKGDPILRVDPRDYQVALDQARGQAATAAGQVEGARHALDVAQANFPSRLAGAQADLREAQAALSKAEADDQRQKRLSRQATTQQQIDDAAAAVRSAHARVESAAAATAAARPVGANIGQIGAQVAQLDGVRLQAEAAVRQAELNLDRCTLRAPQDGWLTKRAVEVGSYVQPGQQIASLVSPDVWITANFKESQLRKMHPGQTVAITIDAYPTLKLSGHIDSVQLGTGNKFTAFPPENATGNFVKIVQRVPVKIIIDDGLDPAVPLPLGLSAVPDVDVR